MTRTDTSELQINAEDSCDETVTVEKKENGVGGCKEKKEDDDPDQYLPRDQLKITLKIFLQEANVAELNAAVTAALGKLSTNR